MDERGGRRVYGHSHGPDKAQWEPLADHLAAVAGRAASHAAHFGWAELARAAGLLHDIGKCSAPFQARLEGGPPCDHSTAGARQALAAYPGLPGRILAHVIAAHHAGLADDDGLSARIGPSARPIPDVSGWEAHAGPLPGMGALQPSRLPLRTGPAGFWEQFLIRMLLSCLVDADRLETEAFYARAEGRTVLRGGHTGLDVLQARLAAFMAGMRARADPGPIDALRTRILDHVLGKADLPPGLFTLTVPTGGGKTLASLSFGFEHARRHGLRRIVYVIPYTSIIEQTAAVFRRALGEPGRENRADILEHHASVGWDAAVRGDDADGGEDDAARLRRATENWDAPVVVTTAVQFFESLFANGTGAVRKLHNLSGSVIVLDEAQTLPQPLLLPCMAALDELQRNYGASIVLCTATQPALRVKDGFEGGFAIDEDRELAPDPPGLYATLGTRVRVERLGATDDATIAERFAQAPQMLCIVNSRSHAKALFARVRHLEGAVHLSTWMVPRHRRRVLEAARARLRGGLPVRIVSTSLIEAGVDIDLPEVWRAAAGLDAIAQAAGRCNRENRRAVGRVVVFEPAEAKPPPELRTFWDAARSVLANHPEPLAPEAVHAYFRELYWTKGPDLLDAATLKGVRWPIMPAIKERAPTKGERDPALAFPFESIDEAFRLIDDAGEPVIVPWQMAPDDWEAETILRRVAWMDGSLRDNLRALQPYTVSIRRELRDLWLGQGVLKPVHPALGDGLLRFADLSLYDRETGVKVTEPTYRDPASNIFPG